jgi:dephospho-CoA kinase
LEALLDQLVRLVLRVGPWIVFATTFVETAFFVGLIVPAEAVVLFAAVLSFAHKFSLISVLPATFFGALCGDQTGYLLARYGPTRVLAGKGRVAVIWRWYEPVVMRLFRRPPIFAVTCARFISFVRTLMPWFAGIQSMPYGKFLAYDALGVLGWSIASVSVGYAAGESWRVVARAIGAVTAYVLGGLLVISILIELRKRMRARLLEERPLFRVALTGNIASGKSTIAKVWQELGAQIIDADVLARRAVEPGTAAFRKIVQEFGGDVVQNGTLDRQALRTMVFHDQARRAQLEAIVHPEVARMRSEEEAELAKSGGGVVVHDIPLLFETGLNHDFDTIVLVDAPEDTRVARIVEQRGLSGAEARAMVAAQMSSAEKRAYSTFVIENNGSLSALEEKARQVWSEIQQLQEAEKPDQ